ncbi:MAG: UDP-N-acetylglucosamine 2-epimerase (hydrolyzing) [Phycisphaeraceae bacterium]|nr:UDP-N-acetylglucosamine 2-epimerase (hydrolyzing) [Phycisphaeraceae bacterium]MBX3365811.1 UDP-N-acetylglucosamine 2-epimerase (hydrolyzing) [Phycisphaeraceae bacterium]
MIGDGWDGEPSVRPGEYAEPLGAPSAGMKRILAVTGSRADFGLLVPVMREIETKPGLELLVVAAGSHLVTPALTYRDVKKLFPVADAAIMQTPGRTTRLDDAEATGRGVHRFARIYRRLQPTWVLVLGDRIEAFAAASAAAIAGIPIAHIHGGDRAEGVADESLRHAITKLAHLHLAATAASAQRIVRMGERPETVHIVGSPAIDGLSRVQPMSDDASRSFGDPDTLLLMHPIGRPAEHEEASVCGVIEALSGRRVLALDPNLDPGRDGIMRALDASSTSAIVHRLAHMERPLFLSLLKRLAVSGGLIVGNSSAALIEAAALKLPAVNVGTRQAGRERPPNVVDAPSETTHEVRQAIQLAMSIDREAITHPYGDGHSGARIADLLAQAPLPDERTLRKRNAY